MQAQTSIERGIERKQLTPAKDNSLPKLMIKYVTQTLHLETNAKT